MNFTEAFFNYRNKKESLMLLNDNLKSLEGRTPEPIIGNRVSATDVDKLLKYNSEYKKLKAEIEAMFQAATDARRRLLDLFHEAGIEAGTIIELKKDNSYFGVWYDNERNILYDGPISGS